MVISTTTVAFSAGTVATFSAGTVTFSARGSLRFFLHIAFGFRKKGSAAEFQFATLFIDCDNLHLNHIADLKKAFQRLGTCPVIFADVHQAFLSGEELKECTELNDTGNLGIIYLTHFGNGDDILDPLDCSFDTVLIYSGNIYSSNFTVFLDIDYGVGLLLNLLDYLTALADNSADEVLRNNRLN